MACRVDGGGGLRRSARLGASNSRALPRRRHRRAVALAPPWTIQHQRVQHADDRPPLRRANAAPQAGVHRDRRRDARALHRRNDRRVQHRRIRAAEWPRVPPARPARCGVVEQREGEERPLSGVRRRLLRLARAKPLVQPARRILPDWNTLYGAPDGVERIDVGAVSSNFLPTLGVKPASGADSSKARTSPARQEPSSSRTRSGRAPFKAIQRSSARPSRSTPRRTPSSA